MPQKTRYDHSKALGMLNKGATMDTVAKEMGVSRQTIYNLKNKNKVTKKTRQPREFNVEFEYIEEWLISRIAKAREADRLKNQLAATQNELNILKETYDALDKKYKEVEDRKRRFALAKQQGEIG